MTNHGQKVKLILYEKIVLLFKPIEGTCQREWKSALRRALLSKDYDRQGLQMQFSQF